MDERKPVWKTSTFLVYTGGIVVLVAALAALEYLTGAYGDAAYAGWAALVFAVLAGVTSGFRRAGRWVAAGVFAFAAALAWAALVGALWVWFGWLATPSVTQASPFAGFSPARLSFELVWLLGALALRRRHRFPLLTLVTTLVAWLFVTDLVSGGGTWSAVVTLLVGLVYAAAGAGRDDPSAFWLHLVGGALAGGAVLYWLHTSDWQWALIAVLALAYVGLAERTGRSSWAVLGAVGLLAAATHFAETWARVALPVLGGGAGAAPRLWVPSAVFGFAGFLLVALGLRGHRRVP